MNEQMTECMNRWMAERIEEKSKWKCTHSEIHIHRHQL